VLAIAAAGGSETDRDGPRRSTAGCYTSQRSQDARRDLRRAASVHEAEQVVEVDVPVARELVGEGRRG
jgi:hypothetical protein